MLKINKSILSFIVITCFLFSGAALSAKYPIAGNYNTNKVKNIERYYSALSNKNFKSLTKVFIKNPLVITSKVGKVNPFDFYPKRFKTIEQFSPHIISISAIGNKYFVRYHLDMTESGIKGTREFLDQIEFKQGTNLIAKIHMFENQY